MLDRNLINEAFSNPRLRAQFLKLAEELESTSQAAASAGEVAASALTTADQAANASVQPFSDLLAAIAELPANQAGVLAIVGTDQVSIYPLGGFMRYLGKGATGARPATATVGIYFDTTLAANGKPIFYTGTGWVDSTGTAV